MSVYLTLGNADNVKHALRDSGVYSAIVEEGLTQVNRGTSAQFTNNIPVDQPDIQAVIKQSMPPEVLEQQTNGVIDGFYAWLHGDTPKLQFQFDLSSSKTKLADGLAAHAAQRMNTLPTCTSVDDVSANFDPFTAACAPKGVDKTAAAQRVRDEILNNKEFLQDPVASTQDLSTNNGQEVQIGNLRINRDMYEQTRTNMYLTGGLAILLAIAVLFLSVTRRAGVRRLAIIAVIVGSISVVLAGIVSFVLNGIAERVANAPDANVLQMSIVDAVRLLTQDIRNWWLLYGGSLLAVGIIALIILGVARRKQPETAPIAMESPAEALGKPRPQLPEDKLKYPRN
jgi:hypothetical protein